jgi:uncharacterized membrane protein YjfL (UPF0719 family)
MARGVLMTWLWKRSAKKHHLHLICEADGGESLSRGIQRISSRIARALNEYFDRKGQPSCTVGARTGVRSRLGLMNSSLLLVGLGKALFGIFVGALGIFAAARTLHRLLGSGSTDSGQREGNLAIGIFKAGSLLALGILLQHGVSATFNAMDLLYRDATITLVAVRRFTTFALVHLSLSIVVSAAVLALGTWVFTRLTRGVDELAEIRKGNAAPAVVLAAVMIVLALMTAPGLQMALDGLLPLPQLGRDEVSGPT